MTFDLEAARAGIAHYRIENPSNVDTESHLKDLVDQANLAEEYLAEIERLRAALAESEKVVEHKGKSATHWYDEHLRAQTDLTQSKRVIEQQVARIKSLKKEIRRLKHESKVEQEFTNSYIKRLHDAEARIKELGSSLDEAEALTKKNAELMNGYLRRIAELEDALVEDLAADIAYDDRLLWSRLDGQRQDEYREKARQQLQAGGKIGNSEHFTDASKMIWHITEERKAAIWHAVAVLKENDPDDEHLWDEEIAVLRAMLTEAA